MRGCGDGDWVDPQWELRGLSLLLFACVGVRMKTGLTSGGASWGAPSGVVRVQGPEALFLVSRLKRYPSWQWDVVARAGNEVS